MLFDAKISAAYSGLTYSQRKVANYVQEKYEDVAFETLEKLAAKAGVSTTTVIRFSRALGYSGYSEMQEDIKKEIQTKGSLPDRLERAAAVSDNDLLSDTFTTISTTSTRRSPVCSRMSWRRPSASSAGQRTSMCSACAAAFPLRTTWSHASVRSRKTCTLSSSPA